MRSSQPPRLSGGGSTSSPPSPSLVLAMDSADAELLNVRTVDALALGPPQNMWRRGLAAGGGGGASTPAPAAGAAAGAPAADGPPPAADERLDDGVRGGSGGRRTEMPLDTRRDGEGGGSGWATRAAAEAVPPADDVDAVDVRGAVRHEKRRREAPPASPSGGRRGWRLTGRGGAGSASNPSHSSSVSRAVTAAARASVAAAGRSSPSVRAAGGGGGGSGGGGAGPPAARGGASGGGAGPAGVGPARPHVALVHTAPRGRRRGGGGGDAGGRPASSAPTDEERRAPNRLPWPDDASVVGDRGGRSASGTLAVVKNEDEARLPRSPPLCATPDQLLSLPPVPTSAASIDGVGVKRGAPAGRRPAGERAARAAAAAAPISSAPATPPPTMRGGGGAADGAVHQGVASDASLTVDASDGRWPPPPRGPDSPRCPPRRRSAGGRVGEAGVDVGRGV